MFTALATELDAELVLCGFPEESIAPSLLRRDPHDVARCDAEFSYLHSNSHRPITFSDACTWIERAIILLTFMDKCGLDTVVYARAIALRCMQYHGTSMGNPVILVGNVYPESRSLQLRLGVALRYAVQSLKNSSIPVQLLWQLAMARLDHRLRTPEWAMLNTYLHEDPQTAVTLLCDITTQASTVDWQAIHPAIQLFRLEVPPFAILRPKKQTLDLIHTMDAQLAALGDDDAGCRPSSVPVLRSYMRACSDAFLSGRFGEVQWTKLLSAMAIDPKEPCTQTIRGIQEAAACGKFNHKEALDDLHQTLMKTQCANRHAPNYYNSKKHEARFDRIARIAHWPAFHPNGRYHPSSDVDFDVFPSSARNPAEVDANGAVLVREDDLLPTSLFQQVFVFREALQYGADVYLPHELVALIIAYTMSNLDTSPRHRADEVGLNTEFQSRLCRAVQQSRHRKQNEYELADAASVDGAVPPKFLAFRWEG